MSTTLDVNYILDEKYVPHPLNGTIPIDEFIVGDQAFEPQAPAVYLLDLTALDDGLLVQGSVSLNVKMVCARCLGPIFAPISSDVDSMFYYEPTSDDDGDPYPEVDEYGHINLESELIEDLIVATPFAPLCKKECKGVCSVCGKNRNFDSCTCEDDEIDATHPFAGLDALLQKDEE